MANGYRRTTIGSVIKSKDASKPNYIKFNLKQLGQATLTITDGMTVSAESKAFQLSSLASAVEKGKLTEEVAGKVRERIDKIPDFVLADLVLTEKS